MPHDKIERGDDGKVCRTTTKRARQCGCACPSPGVCASTAMQLISCSGARLIRNMIEMAISAGGSATQTEGIDILEGGGGDQWKIITTGAWSFNASGTAVEVSNNTDFTVSFPDAAYPNDLSYIVDEDGTLHGRWKYYGTITGTASASFDLYDIDNNMVGSGTGSLTNSGGGAGGYVSMNMTTGAVTALAYASWSAGFKSDNPTFATHPSHLQFIYLGTGGSITATYSGDGFDITRVCEPITISPSTYSLAGSSGAGAGPQTYEYTNNVEPMPNDSDFDGTPSISAHVLTPTDEDGDLLTVKTCNRFLTVDYEYDYTYTDDGSDGNGVDDSYSTSLTITGRVALQTVNHCGPYYPQWIGGGIAISVDSFGHTLAYGVGLAIATEVGSVASRQVLAVGYGNGAIIISSGASGNYKIQIDSELSANISASAGPASVQSAIAAMAVMSGGSVRVWGRGKDAAGATYGSTSDPMQVAAVFDNGQIVPFTAVLQSGFSGSVTAGGGTPVYTGGSAFKTSTKCPEVGSATLERKLLTGETETLEIGTSTRKVGDPQYYCEPECKGDGRSLFGFTPTSLGVIFFGSAVDDDNPAFYETLIMPLTSRAPWEYEIEHLNVSGNLAGNNSTFTITFNTTLWRFELEVTDDESTVCLTAHADCLYNSSLPGGDTTRNPLWVVDTHTGFLAAYTDINFVTG